MLIKVADPPSNLAVALRAGAVYDWILGLVILVAHPAMFRLFHVPQPDDLFHFRMNALALGLLGFFYWGVAVDTVGRQWAARLAVSIRYLGGLFLLILTLAHRPAGWSTYALFGVIDLAWGTLWLVMLRGIKKPAIAGGR